MIRLIPISALLLVAVPALAAEPPAAALPALDLGQETALRCSAAFALAAQDVARSAPGAERYPAIGARGREFFVVTSARLMDDTGASREQVAALFSVRYEALRAEAMAASDPVGLAAGKVRACLPLLDAELPVAP